MIASLKPNTLLPADPLGQRLCETFGRYLWNCIRAELPTMPRQNRPGRPSPNMNFAPECCGTTGRMPIPDWGSLCPRDDLRPARY
jgi:hypothetical protein